MNALRDDARARESSSRNDDYVHENVPYLCFLLISRCKDTAHFLQLDCKLLITLENGVDGLLGKFLR